MNRKKYFPILLGIFCAIVTFWLCCLFMQFEHGAVEKETTVTYYVLHASCFLLALAVFILMLVVLDITREDYQRNNKELNDIEVKKAEILFKEWDRRRKLSLLDRWKEYFTGQKGESNAISEDGSSKAATGSK